MSEKPDNFEDVIMHLTYLARTGIGFRSSRSASLSLVVILVTMLLTAEDVSPVRRSSEPHTHARRHQTAPANRQMEHMRTSPVRSIPNPVDAAVSVGYSGLVDDWESLPYSWTCGEARKSRHAGNLCGILHVGEKATCAGYKGGFTSRFAGVPWRHHQRPYQPHDDAGRTVPRAGQGRPERHG